MTVLERALNPSCNCSEQTAGSEERLCSNICHQPRTIDTIYSRASACGVEAGFFFFFFVLHLWRRCACAEPCDCVYTPPLHALVHGGACMLMQMLFACTWRGVCVCVCGEGCEGGWGVPLPCYSQTICKAGCWSRVEVRGTAGAPLWLINVVAGTPSPPEWRQRPHNAQPVCYACLSLSVDYVVRPWSSAGGVTVPGGRSGPKLITIIWQNACSATVI